MRLFTHISLLSYLFITTTSAGSVALLSSRDDNRSTHRDPLAIIPLNATYDPPADCPCLNYKAIAGTHAQTVHCATKTVLEGKFSHRVADISCLGPGRNCHKLHDDQYIYFTSPAAPNVTMYVEPCTGWTISYHGKVRNAIKKAGFKLKKHERYTCGWQKLEHVEAMSVSRGDIGYGPDADLMNGTKAPSEEVVEKVREVMVRTYPVAEICCIVITTVGLLLILISCCCCAIADEERGMKRGEKRATYTGESGWPMSNVQVGGGYRY